jgi:hypothetical protein
LTILTADPAALLTPKAEMDQSRAVEPQPAVRAKACTVGTIGVPPLSAAT